MKKIVPIVVVLALIVLGAWYFLSGKKGTESGVPSALKEAAETVSDSEETGVTGWVKDLMSGKKMECTYAMNESGESVSVKMFMDKDRYRTEMEMPKAGKMISVFDGKVSYSWTEGTKQGMKMEMDCMDDVAPTTPTEEDTVDMPKEESFKSPEDALSSIPDISCKPTVSVDFSIPSDIVFTDQCQALKDSMKAMEQMKGAIPSNVSIPDDVKKMMGQ